MTLRNSWPGPSGVTTTTDARIDITGLISRSATGTPRAGVFPSHTFGLVYARSDMNVDIAPFQGSTNQFGGIILLANDGTIQLPSVLVSPASGTNFYVVYVKQDESTAPGTDADNLPKAGATLSTVSFAAARALLPTGALELATVQVPTGVASTNAGGVTITQTFVYTATTGGVILVRNPTELAAWTPADGGAAFQLDTMQLWLRQGGAWVLNSGAPAIGAFTPTGIYSAGSPTPQVTRTGNRCSMEGVLASSSTTFVSGTQYTLGSIPAAFAPSSNRVFACSANATAVAAITVASSGTVTMVLNIGFTGVLALALDNANWRM